MKNPKRIFEESVKNLAVDVFATKWEIKMATAPLPPPPRKEGGKLTSPLGGG